MSVVAIAMVKDEADVIEHTIRRILGEVDAVLVADNGSTDGTRELLDELARDLPLTVRDDPEPGYYQSHKMSGLAADAVHELGAGWVIPMDADEIWYSPFGRIAAVLHEHQKASIVTAALYDHVATAQDPAGEPDPIKRIGWRRPDPAPLPKVAVRPYPRVTIHQGNHDADHGQRIDGLLVIRHYPYRSVEQLVRKVRNGAAAYATTDLPPELGAHWREWGRLLEERGEDAIAELYHRWYWREHPDQPIVIEGERQEPLIYDPAP